jgi:uncharacterized membrane protein YfcA
VGLLLGTLGSGGSILMLPILVYAAGIAPQEAVPMAMVVVGSTSLAGAMLHARRGNLHRRGVLLMGSTGVVGSLLGSRGTGQLAPDTLMLIFAAILVVAGLLMVRGRDSQLRATVCHPVRCLSAGLFIGLLTGFLGVGGGFLIVPALVLLAGIEPTLAVGTSLGIITINSAAGLLGQLHGGVFDARATLGFALVALAGMFAGQRVARFLSSQSLPRLFAAFLILVGLLIGYRNLG